MFLVGGPPSLYSLLSGAQLAFFTIWLTKRESLLSRAHGRFSFGRRRRGAAVRGFTEGFFTIGLKVQFFTIQVTEVAVCRAGGAHSTWRPNEDFFTIVFKVGFFTIELTESFFTIKRTAGSSPVLPASHRAILYYRPHRRIRYYRTTGFNSLLSGSQELKSRPTNIYKPISRGSKTQLSQGTQRNPRRKFRAQTFSQIVSKTYFKPIS